MLLLNELGEEVGNFNFIGTEINVGDVIVGSVMCRVKHRMWDMATGSIKTLIVEIIETPKELFS